ncbi:MAG TPA: hypothetical protein PKD57_14655 [Saprospiraceae bacterium]|nr:hypothetical protein [Saprospiraceae bacterium]
MIDNEGKSILETLYLLFDEDKQPYVLGTGRYAKVLLASKDTELNGLLAIKFISKDESNTFNNTSRERFYQEIIITRNCTSAQLNGKFIPYVGFGSLGEPTLPQQLSVIGNLFKITKGFYDNEVIRQHSVLDLNQVFSNNENELLKSEFKEIRSQFLGEFMALEIAYGTLDDLLTFPQNFHQNRAIEFTESKFANARRQLDHNYKLFKETICELKGHSQLSALIPMRGFDQICELSTNELLGNEFRSGLLIEIFIKCLGTLDQIHQRDYAHRDLKPGNFLIKSIPFGNGFWLADLGHVAERGTIINASHTRVANSKDPGVLTPGTKGFRAPEQIVSGDEITFEIINNEPPKLWIYSTATEPEDGDCIESNDVIFLSQKKSDNTEESNPTYSRIYNNNENSQGYRHCVDSEYKVIPNAKKPHYKGYLLRNIGFHSDIFAMGCLLYHLFTDGKNAENNFNTLLNPTYLEQLDHSYFQSNSKKISCLAIAIEICLEDQKEIELQLQHYFKGNFKTEATDESMYIGALTAWNKHEHKQTITKSTENEKQNHWFFRSKKQENIQTIVTPPASVMSKSFDETNLIYTAQVSFHLKRKIPLLILWIIFSCCTRDRPDSICRRQQRNINSKFIYCEGETLMAAELMNRMRKIMTYPSYSPDRTLFTHSGADSALEFFVGFRFFSNRLSEIFSETQPSQTAVLAEKLGE